MSILKKEYELSVWNEELIDGIKKESRGTTIGASGMTHLGRATTPKLVRSVKGTNTLTFQMPTKYFDSEKGDYVKNELLEDLYNERKLKLHYDGDWYEFYVKSIQEDKQFKSIMKTITCTDSFIDELSRTGYEVEFSSDLNNSVEELGTFMETEDDEKIKGSSKAILDGSVWDYRPDMNVGDFTEFNEQRFYKIPLSQFGGTIKGYKINLEVDENDFRTGTEEEKEQRTYLRNPFTKEKRPLEYGDDQARVEELFYDRYEKDNGRSLLSDDNLVEISGDYIYVPITDLTYIMGSVYKSASASLEEPAIYGAYNPEATKEIYALQPVSENPKDLIQFLFFNENDEVLIDEEGIVANKNCHYLITIEQWNEALKKQLKNNSEGLIHWTSPTQEEKEGYTLNKLYTTAETIKDNEKIIYTTKVFPNTRTIDNFNWYPVYYEGYLDKINDEEVSKARKISITDRTELNLNSDVYTTVYNQKDTDFKGLYSEDELNELINRRQELRDKVQNHETLTREEEIELAAIDNDFRVCSKLDTRLILPSLARNLIENGTEITDTNGWEAKTQNINHDIFDTGSYRKMLEINVQQTVKEQNNENNLILSEADLTGGTTDEGVSDYYLELLSPCLAKGDDLSVNGTTFTDYAINFGMIGQEKQIEKGKTYAIRLTTGSWRTVDYNFVSRATGKTLKKEDGSISYDDAAAADYKDAFVRYKDNINALKDNKTFKSICSNKETNEIIKNPTGASSQKKTINGQLHDLLVSISGENDGEFSNIARLATSDEIKVNDYNNSDLVYVKYLYLSEIGLLDNLSNSSSSFYYATYLSNSIVKDWQDTYILKNTIFEKKNNVDLDKVVIGEGSTNLQGNYVLDGVDNTSDKANYIKFSDVADIADTGLVFLPNDTLPPKTKASTYLTNPLYYKRKKDDSGVELSSRWSWAGANNSEEDKDYYSVEDNAFLLFKAKKTIKNPYVAIKLKSGPAQIQFDKIEETTYTKNSGIGVKICAGVTDKETELIKVLTDNFGYLANKSIKIYQIDKNHFSNDFLKSVHFNEDDGTISLKDTDDSNFAKMTDKSFKDNNVTPTWQAQTSTGTPVYFTRLRIKEKNSKKTFGYALFIDDVYYGVFWLEKKS